MFYHNNINIKKQKFSTSYSAIDDTSSLYVNVSKYFFTSRSDNESILEYVSRGNNMFISSEYIDPGLLDTLGVKMPGNAGFRRSFLPDLRYTSVLVHPDIYRDSSLFTYFYVPFDNHFVSFDSSVTRVLGRNESGEPNFLLIFYGSGRIYLHCEPRAFSNYFLLQKDNYKYMQHAFSFMPSVPEHVYWDDYYNKKNKPSVKGNKSGLAVLSQYPAMSRAFWLLLLLLILYVLFEGKRRQRIVPVITPGLNTTVAFTETVGMLYLQKKDNRNIADKMITYFLEHIRNHYFLNTSQLDDSFFESLSRKANVSKPGVEKLFSTIHSIQQEADVQDEKLLLLNQQIEQFYKNKL